VVKPILGGYRFGGVGRCRGPAAARLRCPAESGSLRNAKLLTLVAAGVVALALASQASASVHVVAFTSGVARNDTASLTIKVTPSARRTISVISARRGDRIDLPLTR